MCQKLQAEYDRAPKINYLHQEIAVLNKLATRGHVARLYYCERCDPVRLTLLLLGKALLSCADFLRHWVEILYLSKDYFFKTS